MIVRPIPSPNIPKPQRTFLPLLEERAGARTVVITNLFSQAWLPALTGTQTKRRGAKNAESRRDRKFSLRFLAPSASLRLFCPPALRFRPRFTSAYVQLRRDRSARPVRFRLWLPSSSDFDETVAHPSKAPEGWRTPGRFAKFDCHRKTRQRLDFRLRNAAARRGGDFSTAFRPHQKHPPFQPLRPPDSAAEAGALQTLRAIRKLQANASRPGLRRVHRHIDRNADQTQRRKERRVTQRAEGILCASPRPPRLCVYFVRRLRAGFPSKPRLSKTSVSRPEMGCLRLRGAWQTPSFIGLKPKDPTRRGCFWRCSSPRRS